MQLLRHRTDDLVSEAVVYSGVAYLAGQVAEGDSFASQLTAVFGQIDAILGELGSDKSDLLSVIVWLADGSDYDQLNRLWQQWLPGGAKPARATAVCQLTGPQFRVEVIATAAVPTQGIQT